MFLPGEANAIKTVLMHGAQYGYGNLIAHLRRAWAELLVNQGLAEDVAISATEGVPYPLFSDFARPTDEEFRR